MADNVTDVFGSWLPALAAQQGQQGTTGAKQPRENSSADGLPSKRAKPTRRGGRGRGQGLPQEQIGNVVTMVPALYSALSTAPCLVALGAVCGMSPA